jgi:hypothetical protein
MYDFKKIWPILKFFFIPRSLRTTRNNRSSPHNGPIKKKFSLKSYYLCITNIEIVQNSKSKPKKSHYCVPLRIVVKNVSLSLVLDIQEPGSGTVKAKLFLSFRSKEKISS